MKPTDVDSGLNAEQLRLIVRYDPETGKFFWLRETKNHIGKVGCEAGSIMVTGYAKIAIDGRDYKAHRLAWLWMTGEWPKDRIDHKNRNKSDNRWENLREATCTENKANQVVSKNNKLGVKGVKFDKKSRNYSATIRKHRHSYFLGKFSTIDDAKRAYAEAAINLFGEFARME